MNERTIHILSIVFISIISIAIIWLYLAEPKTISEVATKSAVAIGTYEIDKTHFDKGLMLFRSENFPEARDYFKKADPENRDSKTQFYVAYSFYRQGFGKVYNDNDLFKQGLESLKAFPNLA